MQKTLTITGFERPELFNKVIVDLAACAPAGWHLHVGIEPGPHAAQFDQICASHLAKDSYSLTVNDQRLGVLENPLQTLERAFASGSDLNLHLEEDLRLAPDALQLAEWYANNRKPHWVALGLLAGGCGTAGYLSRPDHPQTLVETRVFNSLGFALDAGAWRDRVHPVWAAYRQHPWLWPRMLGRLGWDWAVSGAIYADPEARVVHPLTARATHDGPEGAHCSAAFQDLAFTGLLLNLAPCETYDLVDRSTLPHDIRAHLNALEEITQTRAELQRIESRQIKRRLRPWLARHLRF